jgi:hypothetical protein
VVGFEHPCLIRKQPTHEVTTSKSKSKPTY